MKLFIADKNKIVCYKLPEKVDDSFLINYYSQVDKENKNINIQSINGYWNIIGNSSINIIENGNIVTSALLVDFKILQINFTNGEDSVLLICMPTMNKQFFDFDISNLKLISIGSSVNDNIIHPLSNLIGPSHIIIENQNGNWNIRISQNNIPIYVNKKIVSTSRLTFGDEIFILGLKIIFLGNFIRINNYQNNTKITNLTPFNILKEDNSKYTETTSKEKKLELYKENEYFFHTPNLRPIIEDVEIEIDPPPSREDGNQLPFIITMGSSLIISLTFVVTLGFSLISIINGKSTWEDEMMSIILGVTFLIGSIVFPIITYYYEKRLDKKREKKRQEKYSEYLDSKQNEIEETKNLQANILRQLYLSSTECLQIVQNKNVEFWNREISDDDFLSIRLGIGKLDASINIVAAKKVFTIDEDNLRDRMEELVQSDLGIQPVPITVSLIDEQIFPIILTTSKKAEYINGLLTQLITYHSSKDLKIVFLVDENNSYIWNNFKFISHCIEKDIRLFGYTDDDYKTISSFLESKLQDRIKYKADFPVNSDEKNEEDREEYYKMFPSYYLIITDKIFDVKNLGIVERILNTESNYGFSLLIFENSLKNLPSACNNFTSISDSEGGIFSKTVKSDNQNIFKPEFLENYDMSPLLYKVSNTPILQEEEIDSLPQSVEFLEMLQVGKIEQLNVNNRWQNSNPTISLSTPIGVYPNGSLFELDLHERAHGPHGLIAGSTGSGKSEFIISYILSMCINYSPYEVQFVLIDYKGGGLAGAFENREKEMKIPHLVGTITNLDTSEMNRTLVSIHSELNRRQRLFNKVKEELGESTIDIYKYQKYYRDGQITEPVSHLFIICDEFAELKAQQPDFMDELISTARIGRSLGVHLILATQKPSGVVDDQIWSNTRFKICLKVQSEADSQEMLKRPEAASIKEAGRFYLQVGYDEIFEIGQSAYSGARYTPTDIIEKKIDDSICFIDNCGTVIKEANDNVKKDDSQQLGDQLTNIVNYLINLSYKENIKTNQLWLPNIPKEIFLEDLIEKYEYTPKEMYTSIIGEYDAPENQTQGLLTLNVAESGNIVIYGIAGSGKENQLITMVYSMCIFHRPQDLNIYIMDFGSEILRILSKLPHVGDYATTYDGDKIYNFLQFLEREFNKRKAILSEFGGNFDSYNKSSEEKLPLIFVILNNYESFKETYLNLEDSFTRLFREASKFGIIFAVTASATNAMPSRVSQNFSTIYALRFNDDFEFRYILNAPLGLVPKKVFGRGLTKFGENILEYQTSYISDFDLINNTIKEKAIELTNLYKIRVKPIPILPSKVNSSTLRQYITDITKVPLGVSLTDINISTYDFQNIKITPILGNDIQVTSEFLNDFYKMMAQIPDTIILMLDLFYTSGLPTNITSTNNIEEFITTIDRLVKAKKQPEEYRVIIINGISEIYTNDDIEQKLKDTLTDLFVNIEKYSNTSFVLIDEYQNFRNVTIEKWYTSLNRTNGIWIGEGIENQIVFTINKLPVNDMYQFSNNIGYLITKSNCESIKIISGDE